MTHPILTHAMSRTLVALALATAGGCVHAVTVQIPNPLTRGLVANRVPNPDESTARYFGLPDNVFTSEASLVSLDPQRACFNVVLRVDGEHANLATPQAWRTFMRGAPNIENMEPIFGQPAQQQLAQMQGSIPRQRFAGYYTTCTRYSYGTQCSQQPRYITVREPAVITVVTGGGAVCFAHGGTVNPRTEQITLHMDDPNTVARRLAFRWRFN
jgi:hypothetical protein